MLAAGPPSSFITDGVGCWGGALWRACNLTSFSPCLTDSVDYLFASRHKGPRFKYPRGYLCETWILLLAMSRYSIPIQHSIPRVSCETGFVSMYPKQEPKEVSKLSKTKRFVWFFRNVLKLECFNFFGCFGSTKKEPKNRKVGERREKGEGKWKGKGRGK